MNAPAPKARPTRLDFASASRTHPGNRRTVNEDRLLERPAAGLWAIADGMGGHAAGDVAATNVIEALDAVALTDSGYFRLTDLQQAIDQVNAALAGRQVESRVQCGSTLVALLTFEGHYACLWAGDSRAYRLRAGVMSQITRDHSIVQRLIDAGALGESERKHHPSAHVITRAIGAAARIELDRTFAPVEAGDVFLLCSDGLTVCVDEARIADLLGHGDVVQAADALLASALACGAPDNVSLVVIRASQADNESF